MHGTGANLIENLLRGARCKVETIRESPDPLFGGNPPEPIASNLKLLQAKVRKCSADLGIANDGDADRLGIVAPSGMWLNPGQVMCLLLKHLVRTRGSTGAVIKTVSNTMMIDRVAHDLGLRLIEVPVGFKYVAELMLKDNILIGGEESGGIGVQGYLPERDGILNGLLLLEAMAMANKKLSVLFSELERRYGQWFYERRDMTLSAKRIKRLFKRLHSSPPSRMAGVAVSNVNTRDGVKLIGRDESWLLFRCSGTEPIVRVYAESPRKNQVRRLLKLGVTLAKTV